MIDLSSIKPALGLTRSTNSLKSLNVVSDNFKGRRLLLSKYFNIGNPQDYSQIRKSLLFLLNWVKL